MTPTLTDADAMLRAVLEDPRDDVARLVYADALEEAGDAARAEVIRRLLPFIDRPAYFHSGLPCCVTLWADTSRPPTIGRVENAKTKHTVVELAPAVHDVSWELHRGLVCGVSLPCAAFLRDGFAKELFSRHPVTSVALVDKEPTRGGGDFVFFCRDDRGDGTTDPWGLPPALYDRLARPFARDPRYGCTRASAYYYRAEDGQADLSAACVAYGRAAAGLPPLPGGAA